MIDLRTQTPGISAPPSLSRKPAWLVLLTPVALFFVLVINGLLGLRFGWHWDEWFFATTAASSLAEGGLLPHSYIYPSFCYLLTVGTGVIYEVFHQVADAKTLATDGNFRIWARFIFLCISSLAVIWVYVITLKITRRYLPALISGLVICASFEWSYHSRWAVSDCIAAQFAILSTSILFLNLRPVSKLVLSSFLVGVAAGAKYTAGIVMVNVLLWLAIEIHGRKERLGSVLWKLILMGCVAALGFLITTPGAILEWTTFIVDLGYQKGYYSSGHYGHTVDAGAGHFLKILQYIGIVLFSKTPLISGLIFLFVLAGVGVMIRTRSWNGLGLFGVILLYVLYVSTFRVMIVRNLLVALPYLAVLAGIGTCWILDWMVKGRFWVGTTVFVLLAFSAFQVIGAALTIYHKNDLNLARELKAYIAENSGKQFVLSPGASVLIGETERPKPQMSGPVYSVSLMSEKQWQAYKANIFQQFEKVIGIEDVNFDYYPTWRGDDRVIIQKVRTE